MGILRTDTISGLETPTPVTGSVSFDGDARNDNLNMSADYGDLDFQNTDFTFESWVYPTDMSIDRYWCSKGDGNLPGTAMDVRFDSDGQINISFYVSSTGYRLNTAVGVLRENVWSHVAVVRNGTSFKSYVNGKETSSATHNITISDVSATFAIGILQNIGTGFKGYMSNFRFVRGKAVYIGEFTPSIYALEPIDGTVLLCCNNPDSAGAEATGKTITVNGDAVASTFSPGLTRDFTYGTQFDGVSRFDTQGYFVPPSGTTEQRGAGNAIFAGGYIGPAATNIIEYMNLNSSGSQRDFGDLKGGAYAPSVTSSSTRALIAGGYISGPALITNIDYVTLSSSGMNALDFGDLSTARRDFSGCSNNTRSVFGGGTTTGSTTPTTSMEYMTSASLGSVASFGDLLSTGRGNASCSSPTRGIFFGGYQAFATPVSTYTNAINYITIATTGSAADFGDLVIDNNGKKGGLAAFSNSTRGVVGGGAAYFSPAYTVYNTIEYITITSTGNAQDFGDLIQARNYLSGTSNSVRGFFTHGSTPTFVNTCEFVTIASTGNAQDFGDFANATYTYDNAGSDSHGGLS